MPEAFVPKLGPALNGHTTTVLLPCPPRKRFRTFPLGGGVRRSVSHLTIHFLKLGSIGVSAYDPKVDFVRSKQDREDPGS